MSKLWTSSDIDIIAKNSDKDSKWLSEKLDRSEKSILSKRSKLKLGQISTCLVCGTHMTQVGKYCISCNRYGRRVSQSKYKARSVGKEFTITDEHFIALMQSDCVYCGETGGGVDRVDSSIGYTLENCVPCCQSCNTMKMDMDLRRWISKMKRILENYNE